MSITAMAPRSRIPTLKPKGKPIVARAGLPAPQTVEEPFTSKKRASAAVALSQGSPNPKAKKVLRTGIATTVGIATTKQPNLQPKRPRAASPDPPRSAHKRARKSNQPLDYDYVPTSIDEQTRSTPRRATRQSLAAQEAAEVESEEDPMDCLAGPGALAMAGDSSERARSMTGFDFTLDGTPLLGQEEPDISSGGLYSDIADEGEEEGTTLTPRIQKVGLKGKATEDTPTPRRTPLTRSKARPSGSNSKTSTPLRQISATPHRQSQSRSPNISRRTSHATARQSSTTPRRQSIRASATTPTPRRRTEPKTLPPPVVTLTAAQARKEARLAAAQAEAEARLRASIESELGGLSVVGEEEEEEDLEPEEDEQRGTNEGPDEALQEEEENSDDPLTSAPVYKTPPRDAATPTRKPGAFRVSISGKGQSGSRVERKDTLNEEEEGEREDNEITGDQSRRSTTERTNLSIRTPGETPMLQALPSSSSSQDRSTAMASFSNKTRMSTTQSFATPGVATKATSPRTKSKFTPRTISQHTTPRSGSSKVLRVRWTPRSNSKPSARIESDSGSEYEDENQDTEEHAEKDPPYISNQMSSSSPRNPEGSASIMRATRSADNKESGRIEQPGAKDANDQSQEDMVNIRRRTRSMTRRDSTSSPEKTTTTSVQKLASETPRGRDTTIRRGRPRASGGSMSRESTRSKSRGRDTSNSKRRDSSRPRGRPKSTSTGQSRSTSRVRSELTPPGHSPSTSKGSPQGRGRALLRGQSGSGAESQRKDVSGSREKDTSAPTPLRKESLSNLGNASGSKSTTTSSRARSTTKSPMRVEVVIPVPPRFSVASKSGLLPRSNSGGSGITHRASLGDATSSTNVEATPRVTLQQPTPDQSSLDRSPSVGPDLSGTSDDHTYIPPPDDTSSEDGPFEQPRGLDGRFLSKDESMSFKSITSSLRRSQKTNLGPRGPLQVPEKDQRDSSVSLGSFWHEAPKKERRAAGSVTRPLEPEALVGVTKEKRKSGDRNTSAQEVFGRTPLMAVNLQFTSARENRNNTLDVGVSAATEGSESILEKPAASPSNATFLQNSAVDRSARMNMSTPRAPIDSTLRYGFDFTPRSEFRPNSGSYAQSTPYPRGERSSLGISSFQRLNLANSSPMLAGTGINPSGDSRDAEDGQTQYTNKDMTRAGDTDDTGISETTMEPDSDAEGEIVPESSPPPDHTKSIDGSMVVEMSSPSRSLRTERVSTPRTRRVSQIVDSDEEPDDVLSSPSAGRQSFQGRATEPIAGRTLTDILKLREQARRPSSSTQRDFSSSWQNNSNSRDITTRLDNNAQDVLQSSSIISGTLNGWPGMPTSETRATSTESNEVFKPSSAMRRTLSDIELGVTRNERTKLHFSPTVDAELRNENEESVGGSVLEDDHPVDKQSIQFPPSEDFDVVQDLNASVQFNASSRAPIRRVATPILRGRHTPSESGDSDQNPSQPGLANQHQRSRSSSVSADSSGPANESEDQGYDEDEDEGLAHDEDDEPIVKITGSAPIVTEARQLLIQAGYVEDEQSMRRFIRRSQSRGSRSRSRSLSGAGEAPSIRHASTSTQSYNYFPGDRTTGLSRSRMMVEASRYEDWEPPSRRQLRPRKWTEHDWRMLAHYLRRVQKSQALASGLSDREELDLMMVNVHAVVDRFLEEEAHGIKLEGEWARSEITGRAVYLIINARHKKDGTWKHTAFNDPGFSAILADMTRPRAPSGETPGPDEDLTHERVLPAALAELPGPSRVAASQLLANQNHSIVEDEIDEESEEEVTESADEQGQDMLHNRNQDKLEALRDEPSRTERYHTERRIAESVAARQRSRELRGARDRSSRAVPDQSSIQVDHTAPSTPSTTFAKFIGSISSYIGGRSQPQPTEASVSFPKLKPVAREPVDLTQDDDDEHPTFPVLNHVPTPARPTPARPRRQKRIEPKLDLPVLQHVSPPPAEPVLVPKRKTVKRVGSVRELAKSFELMEEENKKAAEAARSRIGYGRSVSGPVGGSKPALPKDTVGLARIGPIQPAATHKRAHVPTRREVIEVIEVSDSSIVRESVDL